MHTIRSEFVKEPKYITLLSTLSEKYYILKLKDFFVCLFEVIEALACARNLKLACRLNEIYTGEFESGSEMLTTYVIIYVSQSNNMVIPLYTNRTKVFHKPKIYLQKLFHSSTKY